MRTTEAAELIKAFLEGRIQAPPPGQVPAHPVGQQGPSAVAGHPAAATHNAPTALAPGATVMVAWPNGQRYPGRIASVAQGGYQVSFGDGRTQWVPFASVTSAAVHAPEGGV